MLKIESNLKINGRHWGLQFADGIAYTANVSLAAKLLLKGYVVTDWPEARDIINLELSPALLSLKPGKPVLQPKQPDQPVAGAISKEHELSLAPSSAAQADTIQTVKQSELPVSKPDIFVSNSSNSASNTTTKTTKPKTVKPRKKAVKLDAADAG